ncbi:MAG: hypothetical protein HY840_01995 [Bacteroidetes bacterium]|nr:hypothetical protein [Bacteroidota bacterium]
MPITTPRPKQDYHCTQEELYQVCLLGWDSYLENVLDFTNTNTLYTVPFGQASRAAVITAKAMPDFQARDEASETLLILMKASADQCLILWNLLETHIKKSFPKNLQKPKLESAGTDYYQQAGNNNWASLSALMESANTFITHNTPALIAGGMPPAFPASFSSERTNFETLHTQFKDAEQDSEEQRDTKINANNTIFQTLSSMFEDGQKIYRNNPAKRERFTFSKVLSLISGGSTPPPAAGILTIISNQNVIGGMPLEIIISGNLSASGGGILATWESGITNSADLTAGGTIVFQHVYTATGIKTITVTEVTSRVFADVSALQLPNIKATVITIDGDFSTTTTFNFYGNDLPLTSVYALITQINDYGTSGGQLNISGGTMPVPDPAFPALIALRSRGWMVTTN